MLSAFRVVEGFLFICMEYVCCMYVQEKWNTSDLNFWSLIIILISVVVRITILFSFKISCNFY